jgi:multisubunit Na+/H+ antiporter MnhB subunit
VSWSFAIDVGLVALILALGVFTIAARDTFAAVIAYVAYGILLAIAWVRLHAVDVALTEAAIGGGLSGVLMIGAAACLRATERTAAAERPGVPLRAFAAMLSIIVTAALAAAVWFFAQPAPTLAPEAMREIGATGLGNPVTATLMAYRAMDTFLEKVVLLLAVVGVWSLAPDRLWGGRPGPRYRVDPEGVLPFLARVLPPLGIVLGVYLVWVSAVEPGGAFQGGTVLAAMGILVMKAGLADAPPVGRTSLRLVLLAGPAVFLAVGCAGFFIADAFLAYPVDYAKALIVTIEVPMVVSIAAMLCMLMSGAPQRTGGE